MYIYIYIMYMYICLKAMKERPYNIHHQRNTRNRGLACPPFQRLSQTQRSVSYAGSSAWNMLPPHIRSIESLPVFKVAIRNIFFFHGMKTKKYLSKFTCIKFQNKKDLIINIEYFQHTIQVFIE